MARMAPLPARYIWRYTLLVLISLPAALFLFYPWQEVPEYSQVIDPSSLPFKTTPVNKNYTILIWKEGPRMLRRFQRSYGTITYDPFLHCSVRNCVIRIDDEALNVSDAVMVHLHQTRGPHTLPSFRNFKQKWIFFTDESPLHTFLVTRKYSMRDYNGYFNWSMTYRRDSDVSVPYGRTVPLSPSEKNLIGNLPNYAEKNDRLVAILGSNCGGQNYRWDYVKELRKYIQVDVYGGCGTLKCPGHFTKDCTPLREYKFYLAFENSNCREYMTEKLWWNAYHKESVPVVMGAPKEDYIELCPPHSFIHVDDFSSPAQLAAYLKDVAANSSTYNSYFEWKKTYKVVNEHGYFRSPSLHLCRICEALNDPDKAYPDSYNNLQEYWNKTKDCRAPSWVPRNKRHRRNI